MMKYNIWLAMVNARFWGVSGVYTPLTPQNLETSSPIPKEPNFFYKLQQFSAIVRFIPTSLGSNTAGTFQWSFNGSEKARK